MSRPFFALAFALVLALPSAAVAWSGKGGAEPDTSYDTTDGWMFTSQDVSPCLSTSSMCGTNSVYLNGFFATATFVSTNPNVGAVGSAVWAGPSNRFAALFGVWKDCNDDGVIGLGDQGVMDYRSEVLANWPGVGNRICPVTPTPVDARTGLPPFGWVPSHNDGTWVREFLPLSHDAPTVSGTDPDPWNLNAGAGTMVWSDFGIPAPQAAGSNGCAINPQPVGTYRSTGGALGYIECFRGYSDIATFDALADGNPTTQPFSFSDSPTDPYHSHSEANVQNPWGSESDNTMVQTWDCSQSQTIVTAPVYEGVGPKQINMSQPKVPPTVDATGSPAGTANSTASGTDQCTRQNGGHTSDTLAHAPYGNEAGPSDVQYKTGSVAELAPASEPRPASPISTVLGNKATPCDLGIDLTGFECAWAGTTLDAGVWVGGGNWINAGATGGISYVTTYASVDPTTIAAYHLSLPKTPYGTTLVSGTYGAEACGSFTSGDHGGWDCDPAHWGGNAKVGSAYQLQDIDCYDQSVSALRSNGVSSGTKDGAQCSVAST